ncbi:hypothetical protein [Albirhodobacter sp. R86504]|uniref:hypothetical protein n=1 Tax=Albirhodobacter sp. R86504 TaxID=3093848 RepID=UPI00366FE9D7
MNAWNIEFAPLVGWVLVGGLGAAAVILTAFALWRGLRGWVLRGIALGALALALAGPALQRQSFESLSDIVLLIEDRSSSQTLSARADQTDRAVADLERKISAMPNTELRKITVADAEENAGTLIGAALAEAFAAEPKARIAGAFIVTDGQVHDAGALVDAAPAPVHVLLTGEGDDWDRRLVISNAPTFGIIGEPVSVRLKVEDEGAAPAGGFADVTISIDGEDPQTTNVPVGVDLELPLVLDHGGQNVVQIEVAAGETELTDRNNAASVQINGVRDRLSVLLVSGEPHAGERTWRNLLKSDAGVDLVHFTILRPPEKQDGTPVSELSLIAFPTQELFVDKINDFDLIIFDRYSERGILPSSYFRNIRDYVQGGGAILIAAGPEFASVESLAYSPLAEIIPASPTGRVISGAFLPRPTAQGLRHPVIAALEGMPEVAGEGGDDQATWGRWLRQIEVTDPTGEVVLTGAEDKPLLILSREGEGRVALLASDQAWLWDRGYEGGGPQLELLRRIAHWEMKEPELEEEALYAEVSAGTMALTIIRRTMEETVGDVQVVHPDGESEAVTLTETAPGRFTARWIAPEPGLYRLIEGDLERVVAMGPASPREFEQTIADQAPLAGPVAASSGSFQRIEDGLPLVRRVREGGVTAGQGWVGITPREAQSVTGIRRTALLPDWAYLVFAALMLVGAWLWEGRGGRRA